MITERKLICGTKDELMDYFSFVQTNSFLLSSGFCEITNKPIEKQIDDLLEKGILMSYIFYMKVDTEPSNDINRDVTCRKCEILMDGVQIRDNIEFKL